MASFLVQRHAPWSATNGDLASNAGDVSLHRNLDDRNNGAHNVAAPHALNDFEVDFEAAFAPTPSYRAYAGGADVPQESGGFSAARFRNREQSRRAAKAARQIGLSAHTKHKMVQPEVNAPLRPVLAERYDNTTARGRAVRSISQSATAAAAAAAAEQERRDKAEHLANFQARLRARVRARENAKKAALANEAADMIREEERVLDQSTFSAFDVPVFNTRFDHPPAVRTAALQNVVDGGASSALDHTIARLLQAQDASRAALLRHCEGDAADRAAERIGEVVEAGPIGWDAPGGGGAPPTPAARGSTMVMFSPDHAPRGEAAVGRDHEADQRPPSRRVRFRGGSGPEAGGDAMGASLMDDGEFGHGTSRDGGGGGHGRDLDPVPASLTDLPLGVINESRLAMETAKNRQTVFAARRKFMMDLERAESRRRTHLKAEAARVAEIKATRERERAAREAAAAAFMEQEEAKAARAAAAERAARQAKIDARRRAIARAQQKRTEMERFVEALRARVIEKVEASGVAVPPLCACGTQIWENHAEKCANNCAFYGNPAYFCRVLSDLLASLGIE